MSLPLAPPLSEEHSTPALLPLSQTRPKARGVIHQWAALAALAMGVVLVLYAPDAKAAWGTGIFATSLTLMFSVSAVFHRRHWKPAAYLWIKRADHASIFILIAGTYTPVALLALPEEIGRNVLWVAWGGALLGIAKALFWVRAPKVVSAVLAILVGWSVVPYLSELKRALGGATWWLVLAGGIAYTLGAVAYASKRPRLSPRWFSYHEVFHALTVVAASLHAIAIWRLMLS